MILLCLLFSIKKIMHINFLEKNFHINLKNGFIFLIKCLKFVYLFIYFLLNTKKLIISTFNFNSC